MLHEPVSDIRYSRGVFSFKKMRGFKYDFAIQEAPRIIHGKKVPRKGGEKNVLFFSDISRFMDNKPRISFRIVALENWNQKFFLRAARYIASIFYSKVEGRKVIDGSVSFAFYIRPAEAKEIRSKFPPILHKKATPTPRRPIAPIGHSPIDPRPIIPLSYVLRFTLRRRLSMITLTTIMILFIP